MGDLVRFRVRTTVKLVVYGCTFPAHGVERGRAELDQMVEHVERRGLRGGPRMRWMGAISRRKVSSPPQ